MGPLAGIKLIEMAGIGPAPFAAKLFANMGADVIRIARGGSPGGAFDALSKADGLSDGRPTLTLDLKSEADRMTALALCERADALIEGFRPGVMERLGLGPEVCLARNPRLVYGRITGWGQHGPLAATAGHDINYIALSGALHAIGPAEAPTPPLNLIGDFGGGAMLVAFGIVCALLEARSSGKGQVIDAAMTDAAAQLMTMQYGLKNAGYWKDQRAANALDGGAPFYGTYRCADGRWLAVGALEPQFHDALLAGLELDRAEFAGRWNPAQWPALRTRLAAVFAERSRDEWCARFAGTDACVTPVLSLEEAPDHPHNKARGAFVTTPHGPMPAAAPSFSRSALALGADSEKLEAVLARWEFPQRGA